MSLLSIFVEKIHPAPRKPVEQPSPQMSYKQGALGEVQLKNGLAQMRLGEAGLAEISMGMEGGHKISGLPGVGVLRSLSFGCQFPR